MRAYHRRLARERVMGGWHGRLQVWITSLFSAGLCAWVGVRGAEGWSRGAWLLGSLLFAFLPFGLRRGWTWLRWPASFLFALAFVAGVKGLVEGTSGIDLKPFLYGGLAVYFMSRTAERELREAYGPEEDEANERTR